MDTGATSTVIHLEDKPFVEVLEQPSEKIFANPNGTRSRADKKALLKWNLRQTARDADIVPDLVHNTLISTGKLTDANYVAIFTKDEVKVFDAEMARIKVDGEAVMKGW